MQMGVLEDSAARSRPPLTQLLAGVKASIAEEAQRRQATDTATMHTMAAAMTRLQAEALVNFGTEDVVAAHAAATAAGTASSMYR